MYSKTLWFKTLLFLLALTFSASYAAGQAVFGSIFGTVTDETGAAVAGAEVTITDLGKGIEFTVTTNNIGNYNKERLIPGRYQVTVSTQGFKTAVIEVDVLADVSSKTDILLQPGEITEEITVTAEAPLLKTDRADVSTSFVQREVEEIPILNRNFTQFQLLTPGAQRLTVFQHAASENPQQGIQIQVNGQHFSGTYFELDGTDNRDPILGIIVINPNLDALSEMKVTTNSFDAEFGLANGGVVTAQTKSGSNEIHGSAFWFRRNDEQSARNPFTQSIPLSADEPNKLIPDTLFNLFGGSLGGPIIKNKSFIFGDYQGTRRKNGGSVRTTVPTALARTGDLSEYPQDIFDPLTGQQFAGNVIPQDRLSPQAVALLRNIPLPNLPGLFNNFTTGGIEAFDDDKFDLRSDNYFGQNLHLFGRYSFADFERAGPGAFGEVAGGPAFDNILFAGSSKSRDQSLAVGFDYVISPTVITDFRFGWFKYRVDVLPGGVGTTPAQDVGIPGLNLGDDFTSGMPAFFINIFSGDAVEEGVANQFQFGYSLGVNQCNCPLKESEQQLQFVNNWSFLRGNHSLKFGVDLRRAYNLRVPSDRHRAGELTFNPERTGGPGSGGNGLATFLLGDVSSFSRFVSPNTEAGERQTRAFFYGQDSWRATPKLTLNYGLRWSIIFPETVNEAGNGGWLDVDTGEIVVGGVGGNGLDGNVDTSFGAFAPRLGIAYQLGEKTVLRLGYGRSFDLGTFGSVFGHAVTQNLPVLAQQNLNPATSSGSVFSLNDGPTAPVFPDVPSNGRIRLPNGISAFVRPEKMRLATVDGWNLTIQHELTPEWSAEISYVGNKGTHVFAGFDGSTPNNNINAPLIAGFGDLSTNERRPFFNGPINGFGGNFGWTQGIPFFCNCNDNNYNSMQLKLQRKFSNGWNLLAHYTFAKGLNYTDSTFLFNPRLDYGPPRFDRTHTFVLNTLWELPVGRGKALGADWNRVADLFLGGWQITQTTNVSSGLAFSPTYRDAGADRDTGPARPSIVGDITPSSQNRNQWFTPASDILTQNGQVSGPWARPGVGQFGTASRGVLRGPGFFQTDLSILKNFQVTEALRLQFRAEAFNIFNHVNLGLPNNCVDCFDDVPGIQPGEPGTITQVAPGSRLREWQWAVRVDF